jgi:hypothetical protein
MTNQRSQVVMHRKLGLDPMPLGGTTAPSA